jgi:hypothetical protein
MHPCELRHIVYFKALFAQNFLQHFVILESSRMYQAVNQWVVYNQRKLKITQELYVFGLGSYVLFLFLTSHSIRLLVCTCTVVYRYRYDVPGAD